MSLFHRRPVVLLTALLPLGLLASKGAAQQAPTVGGGPYTGGPTRPFDGTPRTGVYSSRPAPSYDVPRRDLGNSDAAYTPPAIWRGLYIGVDAGYRWSSLAVTGWDATSAGSARLQRGAHLGYNFQLGSLVTGFESDVMIGSGQQSTTQSGATALMRDSWTATFRGRLGVVAGQGLLYATGGLAVANQDTAFSSASLTTSASSTRFGYVVGGGYEYKFLPQFSARIEALHLSFADTNSGWLGATPSIRQDSNVVRAGVSYHFN